MSEEKLRQEAVRRYLVGEQVADICRDLSRSRKWFYKWFQRYQDGDPQWFQDKSHRPFCCPHRSSKETEQLVLSVRDRLERTPYAQIGADTIAWEIKKFGQQAPRRWTINRILKRHGRIQHKLKYEKKNIAYPYFQNACYPGHIHQTDLVGPRYIKGDGRFYSLNSMDLSSHAVHLEAIRSKDDDSVAEAFVRTWQCLGLPDYLQLDNELCFHGSHKYPRSFGRVLQLCLWSGIQPVFIPAGEPWRNGAIEHFNDIYDKSFFRTQRFKNFNELKEQSSVFEAFHKWNHCYSVLGGKTPQAALQEASVQPRCLVRGFQIPDQIPMSETGYIHLIRFIRSDLNLDIFSEKFSVPKTLMYQYVKATICLQDHVVKFYWGTEFVIGFEYHYTSW